MVIDSNLILLFIVIGFIFLAIGIAFLTQGPPYVPTDDESLKQLLKMINKYKPKYLLDMGSGDGKLVIALARYGYRIDGVELNPFLVYRSRKEIKKEGLQIKARIFWGNFWTYDTSSYDGIVLYAIKHIMPRLEKKLQRELKPGSYVFSNFFTFPKRKPNEKTHRARVYKF